MGIRFYLPIAAVLLLSATALHAQSYYYCNSTQPGNRYYESPVFSADSSVDPADLRNQYRDTLVALLGSAYSDASDYYVNHSCLSFESAAAAQTNADAVRNGYRNISGWTLSRTAFSPKLPTKAIDTRYLAHAIGRGTTEIAAKNAAHDLAVKSYGAALATFGDSTCSSLPGRVPLWFCTTDYWVSAKYKVIKTVSDSTTGHGKTKAEAMSATEDLVLQTYPTQISRWNSVDCTSKPSQSPPWTCTLGWDAQVIDK